MKQGNIAVLAGDGIGPEIMEEALKVLARVSELFNHTFKCTNYLIGGLAFDKKEEPLPQETIDGCLGSDAVLLGSVGGPKWDDCPHDKRPEAALLALRKALGVYANLRPAILYPGLEEISPLKSHLIDGGLDLCFVRELLGGIYFGPRGQEGEEAFDTELYSRQEIERIARVAFNLARGRKRHLTSIDKANVLISSRFWRQIINEVSQDYPDVQLEHMYVDNAAMQLIFNPQQFDVLVTSNMFGDILSDEASVISGSLGLLASASLGEGSFGLYEPSHGSAPELAGKDIANPLAMILSLAMMFRHSFQLNEEALAIEEAVKETLLEGYRTRDIMTKGMKLVGCAQMGQRVCDNLARRR